MRVTLRQALIGLLLISLPTVAFGQTGVPSEFPGVFGEVVDVRVVNLEIVVTDKDDVPVRGLGADDFILSVDGEDLPIEFFSEIQGGVALERNELDHSAIPEIAAVDPGARVGTSYLVFIDDYFTIGRDRAKVLRALEDSISLVGVNDRMAIVAFDGKRLEMLSTWTNSSRDLQRALKKAVGRPSHGLERLIERNQFDLDKTIRFSSQVFEGEQTSEEFFRTYLDPNERHYVTRLARQLENTVAAASVTLRSFAQPPGRKVMLLLSGGWPFLPAGFLLNDGSRFLSGSYTSQGDSIFGPLADTANLLGYTLYPVDVPGMEGDFPGQASRSGDEVLGNTRRPDGSQISLPFLREQEVHNTLRFLASETGGKPIINAGRLAPLDIVYDDTRSYYWIGFTPTRGAFQVRSRRGYLDSSRQSEVTMAVESALLFGNSPAEGEIDVAVSRARRVGMNRMEVPIKLSIPLENVTFLPAEGGQIATLELRIAVVDDGGSRSDVPVVPLTIEVPDGSEIEGFGSYETVLKMRRTNHRALIAIYDVASGRILSSSVDIRPDK
jgi:VWFA-related protein